MNKIFAICFLSLLALPVFATVDAHDKVYIVVQDVNSGEFFVERAPVIGCYGLPKGPQLLQFTAEYKVSSNIGCGISSQENINYLTCASIVSAEESDDYQSFSEIALDISKCAQKDNPKFITTVTTAAKLNFPQKTGEIKMNFVK